MPIISEPTVTADLAALHEPGVLLFIGRKHRLRSRQVRALSPLPDEAWDALLDDVDPGDWGNLGVSWVGARKVMVGVLPEPCSRHNSPSRAWAIPALARKAQGRKPAAVLLAVDNAEHARAALTAAARGLPRYAAQSGERTRQPVSLIALAPDGPVATPRLQAAVDAVRFAAELVDTPCADLDTHGMVAKAREVAEQAGARVRVIQGKELRDAGLGGLWGVGKAAVHGPALVMLEHAPEGAERSVAWVGKGIVYDTGGLSLKDKTGMPGMKGDMGGAAAVLAAFAAAAATTTDTRVLAVLCLAENAVGPESTRPDDILHMHSGRTVEVNNTDAEGRLVLADGLSWLLRNHEVSWVADLATLTGAALITSGKQHAAIFASTEDLERAVVAAGLRAGEPVHPLLYAPELHRKEFRSQVADLKNSVKDRNNAQSSCAAQFIAEHLPESAPPWVHIDIAGPAWDSDDRGTGFGTGLLLELLDGL